MEQIIYLEVDDDIVVVRDRLRRAQSKSVLLVVPPGCKALDRVLDLRLLRRQAAALGMGIALVSDSAKLRDLAAQEGLTVFASLSLGRRVVRRERRWQTHDKPGLDGLLARLKRQKRPKWWYWILEPVVVALVLGVLAWSVIVVWPSATVGISRAREPIGVSLWIEASMGRRVVDWDRMQMPARVVQVEVVDRGEISTTGIANVAAEKASGVVLFVNATQREVVIPIDTIVSTSAGTPVLFGTTQVAAVGPKARIRVPIEAVEGGPSGNIPANRINRVAGPLAASLNVTNESSTSGGTTDQVYRVTHGDKQVLSDLMMEKLIAKAHAEISAVLEDEFLPIETLQINPYSIRTNYDHHVNDQSDTLALEMRGVVWGLAVSEETANEIVRRALMRQVRGGFHLLPESVHITRGDVVEVDGETGNVRVVAEGVALMEADIDARLLQGAIRGRPIGEALAYLRDTLPVEAEPTLRVHPTWMKRVPWLPFRINIVETDGVEEVAGDLSGS
jgi:hypothetical protein